MEKLNEFEDLYRYDEALSYVGEVNEKLVEKLTRLLADAISYKYDSVLFLLNSEGGCTEAEKQCVSLVQTISKLTDFTICNTGKCNSAALTVYMAAKNRTALEKATFVWHQTSFQFDSNESYSIKEVRELANTAVGEDGAFFDKMESYTTDDQQAEFLLGKDVKIDYIMALHQKIVNCTIDDIKNKEER